MTTVGSYEAKTHLADLLKRVEAGEHITIAKHGRPVAVLVPVGDYPRERPCRRGGGAQRVLPRRAAAATSTSGRRSTKAAGTEVFVLDCSVTMAWIFDDEDDPHAATVRDRLDADVALRPLDLASRGRATPSSSRSGASE